KVKCLLERIQLAANPTEILCYQNELLTTIGKHCSSKKKQPTQNNAPIDLDLQQLERIEKLIVGDDEMIETAEMMDTIESSSKTAESSFRSAKQLANSKQSANT